MANYFAAFEWPAKLFDQWLAWLGWFN